MAGVKGRSGGARPNSGPKPKTKDIGVTKTEKVKEEPVEEVGAKLSDVVVAQAAAVVAEGAGVSQPTQELAQHTNLTPLEFLLAVMNNPMVEDRLRIDAAKTAAQYLHLKKGDGGVKEEKAEKAKKAAAGKFGASAPPKLVAVNGR